MVARHHSDAILYMGYKPEVGGIGDFIYILFQTFCYCRERNVELRVCIPNHPLNKCLCCIEREPENVPVESIYNIFTPTNVSPVLTDLIDALSLRRPHPTPPGGGFDSGGGKSALFYGNMNDYLHILVKYGNRSKIRVLLEEFRRDILDYKDVVEENIFNLAKSRGFHYREFSYTAIHIRCGDQYLRRHSECGVADARFDPNIIISGSEETRFATAVHFLRAVAPGSHICIFSDNENLREYLAAKYNLIYFPTRVIHVADSAATNPSGSMASSAASATETTNAHIDSFCEFVLLGRARAIFAMTVSNFSRISAFIHGVPLYTFSSVETNDGYLAEGIVLSQEI